MCESTAGNIEPTKFLNVTFQIPDQINANVAAVCLLSVSPDQIYRVVIC